MSDPIYGLHQSQPRDVYDFMRANARKIDIEGRFNYMPLLRQKASRGLIGLNNGLEFIISDEILYFDQPLLDGRLRRYAKLRAYSVAFGSYQVDDSVAVLDEIKRLGYQEMTTLNTFDETQTNDIVSLLGFEVANYGASLPRGAAYIEFLAGAPRYQGDAVFPEDAPSDGQVYNRRNGKWVVDAASDLSVIDGGLAT